MSEGSYTTDNDRLNPGIKLQVKHHFYRYKDRHKKIK